ncbi:heme-binding protein [Thalassotalea sp. ND16A]|uniref:heme-binding protein n=1 Tax=Thalassotalea sp. ND16A TaxID=1535422 RepID=UPI00051A8AE0|nr:heme-binding protein [Thalassotalea sp. ND16A]KGK01529.1 hypothetical protein ND16A_2983 [Thalassotalea sp. ND16A]
MNINRKQDHNTRGVIAILWLLLLSSCGGSSESSSEQSAVEQTPQPASATTGCTGECATMSSFLSQGEVELIISQTVAEAQARNVNATIAVTDRVGNVLAVFRMSNADKFVSISSTANTSIAPVTGGLEAVNIIPDTMAAISKAVTAAYLSSEGNAFSSRTASQIIQQHFPPGEKNSPSGPLFGVQFSQLACSDFNSRFSALLSPGAGPYRSPLGLSADPGGLPLYKAGTPVGAIGVISDGVYGLDKDISGFDLDDDELLALAGTFGFAAPTDRRADVITVVGKTLRFSDALISDLATDLVKGTPMEFDDLLSGIGGLVAVPGYYDGGEANLSAAGDANREVLTGVAFGHTGSGIIPADPQVFKNKGGQSLDAFVFSDANDVNRYPAIAASDFPDGDSNNRLTALEVQEVINQALAVANNSRAQIRQPNGSQARVSLAIVDSEGHILAMARTRDAPVFGADVALQKARTAAFFSGTGKANDAPADLLSLLAPPLYLSAVPEPVDLGAGVPLLTSPKPEFSDYVQALQSFIGIDKALTAQGPLTAFSDRAGGNLSRPNFPDGPAGGPPGPLSKPDGQWSVFSVGLQSDLIYNGLIQHVAFVLGLVADVPQNCTGISGLQGNSPFEQNDAIAGLANGIQIFPGSVPIYRDSVLVGAIGVSGDGIDQDDMIAFLAVAQAGLALGNGLQNAPTEIRADKIDIPAQSVRLRYVNCPQAPLLDSAKAKVCDGI